MIESLYRGFIVFVVSLFASQVISQEAAPLSQASAGKVEKPVSRKALDYQIAVSHQTDRIVRNQIDGYARKIRNQFRHRIGLYKNDEWQIKLKINLWGELNEVHSGSDIKMRGSINAADQLELRLDVKLHDRFVESDFRLALVKMLIMEQMLNPYADSSVAFEKDLNLKPPDWLIHGFDQDLLHRSLGRPSYLYSGYLKNNQLIKVKDILNPSQAEGLTPISLGIFRASAAILVGALCDQKSGPESVRGLLGDFGVRQNGKAEPLIRKNFPAFRQTDQGLGKWWALQLAVLAQQQTFEYYSADKTEEYLIQALTVSFSATVVATARKAKSNARASSKFFDRLKNKNNQSNRDDGAFTGSLHEYSKFIDRPDAEPVLRNRIDALFSLNTRAFPLYKPVIDQYIAISRQIITKKVDGIDEVFQSLYRQRQAIRQSVKNTSDYLNHYEATKFPQRSQDFDSYLKFRDEMKSHQFPAKTDPISRSMDKIEKLLK